MTHKTVRFRASLLAAEALSLDDTDGWRQVAGGFLRQVEPCVYETDEETARAIGEDARSRGWDNGSWDMGEDAWRFVRPCRAVAKRIDNALRSVKAPK